MGETERREYLSSASEDLEAVRQSLENLILDIENLLEDWRENMDSLAEDSEDMDENQERVDHYEEILSRLEEAKGIIEDMALEPLISLESKGFLDRGKREASNRGGDQKQVGYCIGKDQNPGDYLQG